MELEILLFLFFSGLSLVSSLIVVSSTNAVYSVLFLILVFCNVASLLLLFGSEFLCFMFLIVYVGAIAVLFLFVVMMLNVKVKIVKTKKQFVYPIGLVIFFVLITQFFNVFISFDFLSLKYDLLNCIIWTTETYNLTNVQAIGQVFYTEYSFLFILSSLILLVAMIGAIVLTMNQRTDVKSQKIGLQLTRGFGGSVKFVQLRK